jgi:hypothetical protein
MAKADATGAPVQPSEAGLAARLGSKIRKWKDAAKASEEKNAELAKKLEEAERQNKDLASRADGNEAAKQRDEAQAQLRTYKHRASFNDLAKAAGATTPSQIEDLWQLSQYKAETEEPDPKVIEAVIKQQKTDRPHLFGQAQAQTTTQTQQTRPAPGSGRGETGANGVFEITRAQANDPLFMKANATRIKEASQEGRFQISDLMMAR